MARSRERCNIFDTVSMIVHYCQPEINWLSVAPLIACMLDSPKNVL